MADNQPDPNAAPAPVEPQNPAPAPAPPAADNQPQTPAPLIEFDKLDDDSKKYLSGQGITSQEQLNADGIMKIINHGRSSQQTAAQRQAELDKIRSTVNPQPQPANPFALPGSTPSQSATPTPAPTPTPGQATPAVPTPPQADRLQMFTLANQLGGMYPELVDDLTSGKFYQDMQNLGIPLTDADGQININGITTFGKTMQTQKQYEAKLAEMNKPNENNQAPVEPQAPAQPADDAPMTRQMALAISAHVAAGNTHPRQDEATTFLQSAVAPTPTGK